MYQWLKYKWPIFVNVVIKEREQCIQYILQELQKHRTHRQTGILVCEYTVYAIIVCVCVYTFTISSPLITLRRPRTSKTLSGLAFHFSRVRRSTVRTQNEKECFKWKGITLLLNYFTTIWQPLACVYVRVVNCFYWKSGIILHRSVFNYISKVDYSW